MPKLSDTAIAALKPPVQGTQTLWDASLRGFGVRISQGGTKTFIVLMGSGRRKKIGRYPTLTLSQARTEAKRLFAEKTLGKLRPKAVLWEDAVAAFLADSRERNKARTAKDYERLLKRFPFGTSQVANITHEDITRRLNFIDGPTERNHALVAAKVFFSWLQKPPRRYIPHNPCEGMTQTKANSRNRVLTDEELKRVWIASETLGNFGSIVRLLCVTGQRRGEIAALRREWISESAITLPAWLTKNNREHRFPIGQIASSLLHTAQISERKSVFIFSARGKPLAPFNGWSKSKTRLDALAQIAPYTLHDLRRTFATGLAALGTPIHVTEKLLNHVSGTTGGLVAIYQRHQFWDEQIEAVHKWEQKIRSLVE